MHHLKADEGFPRMTTKELRPNYKRSFVGDFDFSRHYHLLLEDATEE